MIGKIEAALSSAAYSGSCVVLNWVNVSVSGTWVGTINIQRQLPGQAGWQDRVAAVTANTEQVLYEPELGTVYRVGFSAYTSGTANVRISY